MYFYGGGSMRTDKFNGAVGLMMLALFIIITGLGNHFLGL